MIRIFLKLFQIWQRAAEPCQKTRVNRNTSKMPTVVARDKKDNN